MPALLADFSGFEPLSLDLLPLSLDVLPPSLDLLPLSLDLLALSLDLLVLPLPPLDSLLAEVGLLVPLFLKSVAYQPVPLS